MDVIYFFTDTMDKVQRIPELAILRTLEIFTRAFLKNGGSKSQMNILIRTG